MRLSHLFLFFLMLFPFVSDAEHSSGDWSKANAFYRQKAYDSAVVYYEKIAAERPAQSVVFYNLGNAYYRLNRIGLAVLNYEKALKRNPGLQEAKDNLQLAQSRISNRIRGAEDVFFIRWWKGLSHPSCATLWSLSALVLFLGTLTLLSLRLFKGRKGISFRLVAACGLLTVIGLALAIAATARRAPQSAVVLVNEAPLMIAGNDAKPAALVPEGTVVDMEHIKAEQIMVTLPDGRSGWMSRQQLGAVD